MIYWANHARYVSMRRQEFINNFSKDVYNKQAAFFIGAGLSCACGLLNWADFLKKSAKSLGISIQPGADLPSIAQFYVNNLRCRTLLNQSIIDAFGRKVPIHQSYKWLAKLPVDIVWTTNYDRILERAYEGANRMPSVISKKTDFTVKTPGSDVTIYKMHGDVRDPQNAVLTKEDYEQYPYVNSVFLNQLKSDLCSKTFLFLGFSMDDPNLKQAISQLRVDLGTCQKTHYLIYKKKDEKKNNQNNKVQEQQNNSPQKTQAKKINKTKPTDLTPYESLWIEDLKRYNIQTVVVNSYDDVPAILEEINQWINNRRIFISGSFYRAASGKDTRNEKALRFCHSLVYKIVSEGNGIITGFGAGVGNSAIKAILQYAALDRRAKIDQLLHVLPYENASSMNEAELRIPPGEDEQQWNIYRQNSLAHSGISLFMYGDSQQKSSSPDSEDAATCQFFTPPNLCSKVFTNGENSSTLKSGKQSVIDQIRKQKQEYSSGMIEEFCIACQQENHFIVPIGCTGETAEYLGKILVQNIHLFYDNGHSKSPNHKKMNRIRKLITEINQKSINYDKKDEGTAKRETKIQKNDFNDELSSKEVIDRVIEIIEIIQSLKRDRKKAKKA